MVRLLFLMVLVCALSFGVTPSPTKLCLLLESDIGLSDAARLAERQLTLSNLSTYPRPVIVAHGKNDNTHIESTWGNFEHSLTRGANVLEVDVQITADGKFIIVHDPTFHNLTPDFKVSETTIAAFREKHPEAYERYKDSWTFGLVGRIDTMTLKRIQESIRLRDKKQNHDVEVITLDQLLGAGREPGKFVIPKHKIKPVGEAERTEGEKTLELSRNPILYLDMKDLNALAVRLSKAPSWDWVRDTMTLAELTEFTRRTITQLSKTLTAEGAHDRSFIAVRHPEVAKMVRDLDPKIRIMGSPEGLTRDTSVADLVKAIEAFGAHRPELIEIKYLNHILSPEFRRIARERGWKLLYNKIAQTDRTQFEGKYENNLPRLMDDILALGKDVVIQTNTVGEVRAHVNGVP